MAGAVQAGERAAREVLCAMGRIPAQEVHQTACPVSYRLTTFQSWLPSVPVFLNFCYSSHCFSGCSFLKILLEIILKHLLLDRKTVPNQWRFIIWSGGVHTVRINGTILGFHCHAIKY